MSKQRPKKRWWVSRDKSIGTSGDFYGIHHIVERPEVICRNTFPSGEMAACLSGKQFRGVFALRIKKGQCVEIERPKLVLMKREISHET